MTEYVLYWLIAANGIAFALMVYDKHRAETGQRRVSEAALLGWAMLGGAGGTFAASRLVRHKTRKQPFATQMILILVAEVTLLTLWAFGFLGPIVDAALAVIAASA